jgi:hypothetical protein
MFAPYRGYAVQSASFRTGLQETVTLLVNAQQAIPNAMGVRVTRGIVSAALAFNRRMSAHCAARFCINQQSQTVTRFDRVMTELQRLVHWTHAPPTTGDVQTWSARTVHLLDCG